MERRIPVAAVVSSSEGGVQRRKRFIGLAELSRRLGQATIPLRQIGRHSRRHSPRNPAPKLVEPPQAAEGGAALDPGADTERKESPLLGDCDELLCQLARSLGLAKR